MIEYVWKSPKNLIHSCAQSISLSKMPEYGISLTSIFPDNTILFLYGKIGVRENQILAYVQQFIFMIFKEENVRANFQILTKICFDLRCSTLIKKQKPEVFLKKGFLEISFKFTGTHLCLSIFFNRCAGLREDSHKGAFCQIINNIFFAGHIRVTSSVNLRTYFSL